MPAPPCAIRYPLSRKPGAGCTRQRPLASAEKLLRRLAGRRQRKELRAPSSSSHRPGWRWLVHSVGVRLSYLQPNTRATGPKNRSAPTVIGRALAVSIPTFFVRAPWRFILHSAHAEVGESLLRRGARNLERTALRPGRPRLRRGGAPFGCSTGLPVATCIVRALAEILFRSPAGISSRFCFRKTGEIPS